MKQYTLNNMKKYIGTHLYFLHLKLQAKKKVSLIKAFIVYAKNKTKQKQDKIKKSFQETCFRDNSRFNIFPLTAVKPAIILLWWEISVILANVFKSY